ncbi:MAG TPA: tetratricopeptide repeat protein [Candidatus Hydrogenedentes bacterium]|nr:tetratricopeptide repeat protein [Candidatus Hydrogenedentota bacterium]HOV60295.1 tetratricopeptide repeat protein [Candidatus Hydrogenedentota bacterium]
MKSGELHLQYRYAIQLIKGQRFAEAYDVLKVIDQERPNTKNVLYALAIAADAMGLTDEALQLCDRLIMEFDHEKAKVIRDRILQGQTIRLKTLGDDSESLGVPSSITGLSSGLNAPPSPPREPRTETLWQAFEEGKKTVAPVAGGEAVPSGDDNQEAVELPDSAREEQDTDSRARKKWNFFSWGNK